MSVEINLTADRVKSGAPVELFSIDQVPGIDPYVATPDGQWFVLIRTTEQRSSTIDLITNWGAELTQP